MKQYKILRGVSISDLADIVNENIEQGWEPCGGLCFAQPGVMDLTSEKMPHPWAQAMVREEEDPE